MKSGFPWHVKGVRQQARETAREAARRSGLSVGEWLDSLIIESARSEDLTRRAPASDDAYRTEPRPPNRIPGFDDPPQARRALGSGRPNGLPAHEQFTQVSSRLDSLSRELDARERRAAEAEMSAVNSRLDAIARQLDQRQTRSPATVRERLDTLAHQVDGRVPEADLGAVKERLDALAQQFEQRQNRVPDGDLDEVRDRLDTLAETLDQRQRLALEAGLTAVKNHVDSLAQKLDQRQSQLLDRGLTTVRDRIDQLASLLEQQRPKLVPDEHLAAVNERLDLMVQAVDQLARTTVPGGVAADPAHLAQQQRQVAEAELAAVKERLDALALQLDQRQNQIPDDHLAVVRDRLDRLTQQLDQQQRRLPDQDLAAVNERLDALVTSVDQLVRVNAAGVDRFPVGQPADDTTPDLAEAIARLDLRLDQLISEGRSATSEIEQRVSAVDRAVAELNRAGQRPAAADPATPLDQALFEITERQRALDGEPGAANGAWSRAATQDLAELREQLRGITAKFETMRPCGIDSAVDTLRNDLAEIGLMIKEAMPRKAIQALENEVRSLSERIGEGRQAGAAAADIAGLERGLAEVRDALRTLTPAESLVGFEEAVTALSHKIDTLTVSPQDPATLDQLEAAIAALRGIVAHVASNDALAKLGEDVRTLADKVDQLGYSDALSNLEQRITAIADVMHTHNQASQDAHALANVVEGLTDKLEKIQLTRSDQTVVGHLEDRIVKLVEKLDACDSRLVHLETIERGLAELLIHLEHQRLPAVAHAGAGEAPEVDTLKREVQQTQNSVEGVHNVLDQLVDRLASLESNLRQGAPKSPAVAAPSIAPASSGPAPQPRPLRPAATSRSESVPAWSEPAADLSAATLAPGNPLPANDRERRPIDPTLPPDHPIEPGSGVRARGGSAAERIAASEAALGAAKPPVIPDPGGKSNFIAAARRAAKAALAEAPARADKSASAPAAAGAASAVAPAAGDGTLVGRISKRMRSLLVATSVVLIVLGSVHFAMNLFSSSENPASAPAAPATRSEEPATATPPGRQSAISPNAPSLTFGLPGVGAGMPAPPRTVQVPVPPTSPAQPADGVITGTVRVLDAPAPDAAQAAARATGADKLPATIGAALRAAASKGDPTAEFEIAVRFAEGRGVPQDFATAAEWFERAAKGGLVPAQFRLGGLYEKGLGVTKDLDKARRLYLGAAEAGNAKAMHNLAVLHSEGGFDGKPDFAAAAKWFRKAADYGVGDSQYNLGILYARGIGVEANLVEAYRWFALAAREGDADAGKKRDEIGARIDQQALMAARAATQVWNPARQPELAVEVKAPAGGWDAAALPRAPTPAPAVRRVGPKAEVKPDAKAGSKTSARTDFKTDFKLELPPYLTQ